MDTIEAFSQTVAWALTYNIYYASIEMTSNEYAHLIRDKYSVLSHSPPRLFGVQIKVVSNPKLTKFRSKYLQLIDRCCWLTRLHEDLHE